MKEAIEQQICDRWEYDKACKPENQKLFPFFVFTNFNTNRNYPAVYAPLNCNYCGECLSDTKGGYYTAHIVFESANDVRLCCDSRHCRKGKVYKYAEQIHGYSNPVGFPAKFNTSLPHLVVARCFFSPTQWYALNRYVKTGITWEQLNSLSQPSSHQGGSHVYPENREPIECRWQWNGSHLTAETDTGNLKLNKSDIIRLVNEILAENNPAQKQQLSLF